MHELLIQSKLNIKEILVCFIYGKGSDVYALGMIMWEVSSGEPVFLHPKPDHMFGFDIYRGLRPAIVSGTLQCYSDLMMRCWDADLQKRPKTAEVRFTINDWYDWLEGSPSKKEAL